MKKKLDSMYLFFACLCCGAFVVYAIYVNSFGPNASLIMQYFNITESRHGFIITVQSVGGLLTAVWLSLFGERYNKIYVISACLALLAAGSILTGVLPVFLPHNGGYMLLLLFVLASGIGYTGIDVMMNGAITEVYPEHKDTILPVAHAFYSTGAMAAPVFVALTVDAARPGSFSVPFLLSGIMSAVVGAAYLVVGRRIMPSTPYADMARRRAGTAGNPAEVFRNLNGWLILCACLLYFSFMYGLSVWMPVFFQQEKGMEQQLSGLMSTVFFLGALLMRFASPFFFRRIPIERFYAAAGILSAVCMAAAFAAGPSMVPLIVFLVFAGGFLQGANTVALVMISCSEFPERTASASAITVLAFNLAAMITPLAVGFLAENHGFMLPMYLLALCMAGSVLVVLAVRRPGRAQRSQASRQ
ncbi:MAG: MFS transporter [Clostridiaceae bacterium]|jgi:MFS family permease|nr:MFS transporter [Clostridiaceae bacterium]